jgi:perosamine synthetase
MATGKQMSQFFPVSRPSLTELETEYVTRAIESGWVSSSGPYIEEFEERCAKFCGSKFAVSVSNGTLGLHLAMKALGLGPGDEVLVPDLSFIATANSVLMSGAKPVFVDIDPENLCLDPNRIEAFLTKNTRAILPVHLYGHPADMIAIRSVADRFGLVVIEDSAEAHGAAIGQQRVGSFGDCGVFSFYGNKILTTGEGGIITTSDREFAQRCRHLRDHAMSKTKRYWHEELGYNYRMTNLQAALGCAQLSRIDELIDGRQQIMTWYREALSGRCGLTLNRKSSWATPSCWLACVEFDKLDEPSRAGLMRRMSERGVDTRPYFYPLSDMPHFSRANTPIAHAASQRGMNLPTYLGLTRGEVTIISSTLLEEAGKCELI